MIGQRLAHYEIRGLLGKGGMGEVFRAHDLQLDRDVALKILPAALASDADRLERFHREAKTVAGLNHPHIVHMYSVAEHDGVHFLTMELVDGEELGGLLREGGLPLRQVLDIGLAISEALAEAHAKNVVHRDLKPANVMVTREGRVKVLDFGLAKFAREPVGDAGNDETHALELTRDGSVLGTVPYMSPEQLRGQEVDHRSDLFSLGIILHELMTGRRPFAGDTYADVTSSILKDEPPRLASLDPGVPEQFDRIVRCCLEKDREDRYARAGDVVDALRTLQQQLESGSDVTIAVSAVESPSRSRRSLWIAVAAVAAILAGGIWWGRSSNGLIDSTDDTRPVVAVLPFENLGSDEQEFFATGITDEIASRLTLINGLGVISRTSTRKYTDSELSIDEIGRELASDFVLEGSIRWDAGREPARVRITPRLIRVDDGTSLWSDNYERDVEAIFDLQAAIAARIAEALDVTIVAPVRDALTTRPTEVVDAYEAYLRGIDRLNAPGFDRENFASGVSMLERAVTLDPGFALAFARLSSMHSRTYHYGFDRTEDRKRRAKEAADRALALAPDLAKAHLALGHFHYWCERDYGAALDALERARALVPNDNEVWLTIAYVERRRGNFEESLALLRRDARFSPRDPNVAVALSEVLGTLRRFDEAERELRRAIVLAPDDPYPYTELALLHLRARGDTDAARAALSSMPVTGNLEVQRVRFLVEWFDRRDAEALAVLADVEAPAFEAGSFLLPIPLLRAQVLRWSGDAAGALIAFEEARAWLADVVAREPDDARARAALGLSLAGLGRATEALGEAERALELMPLDRDALAAPQQFVAHAMVHVLLDQPAGALASLERVLEIPSIVTVAWLEADPRWDALEGTDGFEALRKRFGRD